MFSISHSASFSGQSDGGSQYASSYVSFAQLPAIHAGQTDIFFSIIGTVDGTAPEDSRFSVSDFGYFTGNLTYDSASATSFGGQSGPIPFPEVQEPNGFQYYLLSEGTVGSADISGSATVVNNIPTYFGSGTKTALISGTGGFTQKNGVGILFGEPYVRSMDGTATITYVITPDVIGTVEDVEGTVYVIGPDGVRKEAGPGTPIHFGDIVETEEDGAANIVFKDDTTFTISGNAEIVIDEYIYDTSDPDAEHFSFLRGLFIFTSDLIGNDNETDSEIDQYQGGPGIRGDAAEIIKEDLLENPTPEFGDVGIWVETGSPVTAEIETDFTGGEQTLSFDMRFLDPGATLTVSISGLPVFEIGAEDDTLVTRNCSSYH